MVFHGVCFRALFLFDIISRATQSLPSEENRPTNLTGDEQATNAGTELNAISVFDMGAEQKTIKSSNDTRFPLGLGW